MRAARQESFEQSNVMTHQPGSCSRRAFVGQSLGTAALTAAGYERIDGANDRVGIGFIGYGLIGKRHVLDFKQENDVDLIGLAEVNRGRRDEGPAESGRGA